MKTLFTLLLLFLTTGYTLAEVVSSEENLKHYDVEIIIFEDAHARYLTSEKWQENIITEALSTAETEINEVTKESNNLISDNFSPNNQTQENLAIEEISTDRFQSITPDILNKQYKRIKASSQYNVLFYGAWRQAGLDKKNAFEINIGELENTHTSKSDNTLTGTFRLVLRRFLHIHNQLDYQRVVAAVAQGSAVMSRKDGISQGAMDGGAIYEPKNGEITPGAGSEIHDNLNQFNIHPINSHRRMRSKELHYIDHPLVGILIQINPVEKTKETKDQEPTT
jgi:hypothetical protein